MPERPPVKLVGLPDGNLNGLQPLHDRAMEEVDIGKIPHAFLLVEVEGDDVTRKLTTGVETLKLRVVAVEEVHPDHRLGDDGPAEKLAEIRSERVGDNPIPFGADLERLDDLRRQLGEWREAHDLSIDVEFVEVWQDYYGEDASYREATGQQIAEFLAAKREETEADEDTAELHRAMEEDGENPQEESDDDSIPVPAAAFTDQ